MSYLIIPAMLYHVSECYYIIMLMYSLTTTANVIDEHGRPIVANLVPPSYDRPPHGMYISFIH